MIELAHVGTGALAGSQFSSPVAAAIAGATLHGLLDIAPHGELPDPPWEIVSTVVGLCALALAFGPRSPVLWGAIGSVVPDLEIVLSEEKRLPPIYPTHRFAVLHSSRTPLALSAGGQVMVGGALIGMLLAVRRSLRQR